MHNYRATAIQRIASEIRYIRNYGIGDLLAALATLGILILAPIIMALGR